MTTGGVSDVHVHIIDLDSGGRTQFSGDGEGIYPVWSPDGSRLSFSSSLYGPWSVFVKGLNEVGEGKSMFAAQHLHNRGPTSWSPNGTLAFIEENPTTADDIWTMNTDTRRSRFKESLTTTYQRTVGS